MGIALAVSVVVVILFIFAYNRYLGGVLSAESEDEGEGIRILDYYEPDNPETLEGFALGISEGFSNGTEFGEAHEGSLFSNPYLAGMDYGFRVGYWRGYYMGENVTTENISFEYCAGYSEGFREAWGTGFLIGFNSTDTSQGNRFVAGFNQIENNALPSTTGFLPGFSAGVFEGYIGYTRMIPPVYP